MIGPLEIAILVLILLVVFGAKFLPKLARSAGRGVRIGKTKGEEIASVASEKAQAIDTKAIARTAGEHVRDAREVRDLVKGEDASAAKATDEAAAAKTTDRTDDAPDPPKTGSGSGASG